MSHIGQNLEIPVTVSVGEINLTTDDLQNANRDGGKSGGGGQSLIQCLLMSEIDVGPTVIILDFFPGPTALLKALRLLIFGIFSRPYG